MPDNIKSFEDSIKQLEDMLHKINSSETSLDESIDLYAKAAVLLSESKKKLDSAKIRIEEIDDIIKNRSEGELTDEL